MTDTIVIERDIKAPIENVFDAYTNPEVLTKWHNAGDGWQTPYAEIDPVVGGKIKIAYADPEGNVVFDFEAVIEELVKPTTLYYRLGLEMVEDDARQVTLDLTEIEGGTHLRLEFDIENINDKEMQRQGWTNHVDNLQKLLEG